MILNAVMTADARYHCGSWAACSCCEWSYVFNPLQCSQPAVTVQ